mgnify:CR=1 FL=1
MAYRRKEIAELPAYFRGLSQDVSVRPKLIGFGAKRIRFQLLLITEHDIVRVYENGSPAWFSGVVDAMPVLADAYVHEILIEEVTSRIRGCF